MVQLETLISVWYVIETTMMLCGEVLCVTIHRVDQDEFSTIAFGVTIPSALNNGQCAMIICYLY